MTTLPKTIAGALKENNALKSLYLVNNGIGDEGATAIAGALRVNTTLRSLELRSNSIGDEAKNQLRDMATQKIIKLKI